MEMNNVFHMWYSPKKVLSLLIKFIEVGTKIILTPRNAPPPPPIQTKSNGPSLAKN